MPKFEGFQPQPEKEASFAERVHSWFQRHDVVKENWWATVAMGSAGSIVGIEEIIRTQPLTQDSLAMIATMGLTAAGFALLARMIKPTMAMTNEPTDGEADASEDES